MREHNIGYLRMRYLFQSTGRLPSYRNKWFYIYMMLLRDFVPEWNYLSGTETGVNSRGYDISAGIM